MHGTPQQVTGVQIAYMLPLALLGPLSGVFVDRWPLKPTLVASDLIRAGLVLLLFVTTSLWQIYLVLCALSCVSSFFGPAQSVTIRSHVPPHGLHVGQRADADGDDGHARRSARPRPARWSRRSGRRICYAVDFVSFLGVRGAHRLGGDRAGDAARARRGGESTNSKVHADPARHGRRACASSSITPRSRSSSWRWRPGMFMIGCFGPLIAIYVREWLHAKAGHVRHRQRDGRASA